MMSNRPIAGVSTDTGRHPEAEALYQNYLEHFASDLSLKAKELSLQENVPRVYTRHVRKAYDMIVSGSEQAKLIPSTLGNILIGGFLTGFFSELFSANPNKIATALYVILGFIGIGLSVWGFRR
jgi:hypothetical protein